MTDDVWFLQHLFLLLFLICISYILNLTLVFTLNQTFTFVFNCFLLILNNLILWFLLYLLLWFLLLFPLYLLFLFLFNLRLIFQFCRFIRFFLFEFYPLDFYLLTFMKLFFLFFLMLRFVLFFPILSDFCVSEDGCCFSWIRLELWFFYWFFLVDGLLFLLVLLFDCVVVSFDEFLLDMKFGCCFDIFFLFGAIWWKFYFFTCYFIYHSNGLTLWVYEYSLPYFFIVIIDLSQ